MRMLSPDVRPVLRSPHSHGSQVFEAGNTHFLCCLPPSGGEGRALVLDTEAGLSSVPSAHQPPLVFRIESQTAGFQLGPCGNSERRTGFPFNAIVKCREILSYKAR